MNETEKKHTQFVPGGTYTRRQGEEVMTGSLIGAKQMPNGVRVGSMITANYSPEKVIETRSLDDWMLTSVPVPVEMFEKLKQLVALSDGLEAMVDEFPAAKEIAFRTRRALEDAGLRDPEPEPDVEPSDFGLKSWNDESVLRRDDLDQMKEHLRRHSEDFARQVRGDVSRQIEEAMSSLIRRSAPATLPPEPVVYNPGANESDPDPVPPPTSLSSRIADIAAAGARAPAGVEEAKTELAKLQSRKRTPAGV